jgi:AraC-like DNA-binding protein
MKNPIAAVAARPARTAPSGIRVDPPPRPSGQDPGRDIRQNPCASLPELELVARTEIHQALPRLDLPFVGGCLNLYIGYKGAKQMQADGRVYDLRAGDIVATGPGIDHATGPMPVSRCAHYWLRVRLDCRRHFCGAADLEPVRADFRKLRVGHARWRQGVLDAARAIYALAAGGDQPGRDTEMRLQLGLLMVKVDQDLHAADGAAATDARNSSASAEKHATSKNTRGIDTVIDHLKRHLGEDLSVPDLAAIAGCSVTVLQDHFRTQIGSSPAAYFTRLRMEEAARLLTTGTLPLAAIAERLGYANERSFSAVFRKWHLIAPGRFRQRAGK